MGPDLSHVISSARFPRLLLVENDVSTYEPLIRIFADLDVYFDVCTSPRSAVRKLLTAPYQLTISGAPLAEMDDFLLLKRTQTLEPFVPLLVTASASEKESARRVLWQGAFDLIPIPLDHEQTVNTIRLALWQSKLLDLIARREQVLDKYRQHLADYPGGREKREESFNRTVLAFENAISSIEQTILRIEESMVCFSDFATKVECHARKRAFQRLDSLPQSTPPPLSRVAP